MDKKLMDEPSESMKLSLVEEAEAVVEAVATVAAAVADTEEVAVATTTEAGT